MRHHQQLPEDENQVSRNEAGQLLLLLGPLVRLAYYQFARVATRSVKTHREYCLRQARNRMLPLPSLGKVLFAGNFQQKLKEDRPWGSQNSDLRGDKSRDPAARGRTVRAEEGDHQAEELREAEARVSKPPDPSLGV